ncbi:hypothetical protein B0G76_7209 [Paraburkholderia sp. BL23I1N1]|nr:hypothetical protein [Paraburkholderia sp. BL23I1N1]RKE25657.1 hypothetical protein B0G76_7209 [Paraburkholderia sp. BL23I1N1]
MQTVSTSRTRSLQKAPGPYMHEKDEYPMNRIFGMLGLKLGVVRQNA